MRPLRLFHFDLENPSNAGDLALFQYTRLCFEQFGDQDCFTICGRRHLRTEVSDELIDEINGGYDAVLIGGGGLLMSGVNASESSGWQWNCSIERLRRLNVPIIVFAVGFNKFRRQPDFLPVFRKHLALTIEKSAFFGLRNHGSIAEVRALLPDERLGARIRWQPCPTTIAGLLTPFAAKGTAQTGEVAFNLATDRPEFRHRDGSDGILAEGARIADRLSADCALRPVGHTRSDRPFVDWAVSQEGLLPARDFHRAPGLLDLIDFYAGMRAVIGMRGHAQMIPFGLGVPIVSLVSHEKLKYFLEDVGLEAFGVDMDGGSVAEDVARAMARIAADREGVTAMIRAQRQRLHDVTVANLSDIYKTLAGADPFVATIRPTGRDAFEIASLKLSNARLSAELVAIRAARNTERSRALTARAKLASLEVSSSAEILKLKTIAKHWKRLALRGPADRG